MCLLTSLQTKNPLSKMNTSSADIENGISGCAADTVPGLQGTSLTFTTRSKAASIFKSLNAMPFWRRQNNVTNRDPIIRQIHKSPRGYPKLAAFLDSDDRFMVFRRFGYLQSRLLLEKQDDLRKLETQLDRLDMIDEKNDWADSLLKTREVVPGDNPRRQANLLLQIEAKFCEYTNLLTSAQVLTSMSKPSADEHASVGAWIDNVRPCYDAEHSFIYQKEDLITLRPGREHAWLDSLVEKMLRYCKFKPVTDLFRSKETRLKSDGSNGEVYFTRSRINRVVITMVVGMMLVLLVIPVYLLFHYKNDIDSPRGKTRCMGILLIATFLFSACISLATQSQGAKRHEILAASAGYCAVLVVFISNVGTTGFRASV